MDSPDRFYILGVCVSGSEGAMSEPKKVSKPALQRTMTVKWCDCPPSHDCPYNRGMFAEAIIKEVENGNVIVFHDEQDKYREFE